MPNREIERIEEYFLDNSKKFFWIGVLQSFSNVHYMENYYCYDDNLEFINEILKVDYSHKLELNLINNHDYHDKDHKEIVEDMTTCLRIHNLQMNTLTKLSKGVTFGYTFQILFYILYFMMDVILLKYHVFNLISYSFMFGIPFVYVIAIIHLALNRTVISEKILEKENG